MALQSLPELFASFPKQSSGEGEGLLALYTTPAARPSPILSWLYVGSVWVFQHEEITDLRTKEKATLFQFDPHRMDDYGLPDARIKKLSEQFHRMPLSVSFRAVVGTAPQEMRMAVLLGGLPAEVYACGPTLVGRRLDNAEHGHLPVLPKAATNLETSLLSRPASGW